MQVEYLVRISLPDEGWDVNMLEDAWWGASREASQGLLVSALQQKDQEVVALAQGDNKGKVPRWLTTRLGYICFYQEKVHGGNAEDSYPLDKAIGLQRGQRTTLWVQTRACELATGNTYRPAAELLSAEIGDEVSHGAVWSRVQTSGKALRKEEDERRETVFEYGEVFEGDGEEREIVITEMESETAKYKRYRLKEKTLYGGIEDPDEFGEKLYLKGEEKLCLSKARHQLVLGDGDA